MVSESICQASDRLAVDDKIVTVHQPVSWEAERFRTLRHAIMDRAAQGGKLQAIAVTSAAAGDGKTVTAVNLAVAMSEVARVLLIDADLRCGRVAEVLGCDRTQSPGLAGAVLDKSCTLANVILSTPAIPRLTVLPGAKHPTWAPQVLRSPRLGAIMQEARNCFDYVVVDTPPVAPVADCRALAAWVDGFVVVVAAHRTPRKLVLETLEVLGSKHIIGMVFNGDDAPLGRGPNRYYYQWPASLPKPRAR